MDLYWAIGGMFFLMFGFTILTSYFPNFISTVFNESPSNTPLSLPTITAPARHVRVRQSC